MPASELPARPAALFSPLGIVLTVVFALALLGAGLSTQGFIKRRDLPPPGVFVVIAGQENSLFLRLAQKSIKGLHRAVGLRAQLAVPGEPTPRPLSAHSQNSATWETKIKTPQLTPGAKPSDIEANIAVLLRVAIPDDPKLYGRIIPATFELDMLVPRLDPTNPKIGQIVPEPVTWAVQLQIQPPGFLRLYQKLNRVSLFTAGGVIVLTFLRQLFRRRKTQA